MADAPSAWTAASAARRAGKSAGAFRTISEVSTELEVPQHVLRFWETKFPQVKPLKRAGGRRYYRPEDVSLLRRIRDLLYRDGFTIKGAQKLLRETGKSLPPPDGNGSAAEEPAVAVGAPTAAMPAARRDPDTDSATGNSARRQREAIEGALDELEALRDWLRERLG